ncbi:MAG: hypothetical protein N5P05_004083 (plasmid) [Chroococcopsis gigantea SAG 12.99]|jgi:metal-responsive CopG/Arc/MetJ family transcriptional regulator|nr:hypothetical protein [Chroococcopsis gigantea SAG 12.99]
MGKQKIGVTLDEHLLAFLDEVAGGNRSEYLNKLLMEKRRQVLEQKMIAALQEDIQDAEYLQDLEDWDGVAGDGLDAGG